MKIKFTPKTDITIKELLESLPYIGRNSIPDETNIKLRFFRNFEIDNITITPMKNLSMIACIDSEYGIGFENKLMYKVPGDLPRFKRITTGHRVIMGWKTFESMSMKPLPNRKNVIVTKKFASLNTEEDNILHLPFDEQNLVCIGTPTRPFPESLELFKNEEEVFIIGGQKIYEQCLPLCSTMYLTVIHEVDVKNPDLVLEADTYFPRKISHIEDQGNSRVAWVESEWEIVDNDLHMATETCNMVYSFITLKRIYGTQEG